MSDRIRLKVNGSQVEVAPGSVVYAALVAAGISTTRRSVSGEARAALCGMGICFECRVSIDGQENRLSCQIPCREGMEVICHVD